MLLHITIKKFAEYNPRTDVKRMQWIRLEVGTPRSPSLFGAKTSAKWTWICLLCHAGSQKNANGEFQLDLDWFANDVVKEKASVISEDLEWLSCKGLLEIRPDPDESVRKRTDPDGNVLTGRDGTLRDGTNETYSSPSGTARESTVKLSDLWNLHCGSLPKITKLSDTRKRKVRARLNEEPDEAYWVQAIKNLAASSFCLSGGWCTFDWLIANDTNHVKASADNYANKDASAPPGGKDAVDLWLERSQQ